ncbi:MAG: hypothetical protein EOP92_37235 [Lysobacteraceae bacterium]|nr:MAG: hypothetical protein EOP92_37235 [Xanthomonadaceae bacterium]
MNKPVSSLLVAAGTALAAATFYDASLLTRSLGLPLHGGEAVTALAAVSLSAVLILLGLRGLLRRQPIGGAAPRVG